MVSLIEEKRFIDFSFEALWNTSSCFLQLSIWLLYAFMIWHPQLSIFEQQISSLDMRSLFSKSIHSSFMMEFRSRSKSHEFSKHNFLHKGLLWLEPSLRRIWKWSNLELTRLESWKSKNKSSQSQVATTLLSFSSISPGFPFLLI